MAYDLKRQVRITGLWRGDRRERHHRPDREREQNDRASADAGNDPEDA